MLRKTATTFALVAATITMFAQTGDSSTVVYHIMEADKPILAASAALNAVAFIETQNLSDRTQQELAALKMPSLIAWDEQATRNHSASAAQASDWVATGSALLPLTLLVDRDIRDEAAKLSVLLTETAAVTNGLTLATKRMVLRDRPYTFNRDASLREKLSRESMLSFYSGHTAITASMSFFTAKVWSDYHPTSRWKPVVWAGAATLPVVTGYLRYKAGKHYFTDVATGYFVGALVGYFVPHFHKVDRRAKHKYRVSSTIVEGVPLLTFKWRL